jgi:acyl-CoA thioester hydrolase
MNEFSRIVQIRWSDLDPNFHLRHSVYYDWGAFCRMEFLNGHGLTPKVMQELMIGPILFREECSFRKEVRMGDQIRINLELGPSSKDFSRWSIHHQIIRDENIFCAQIKVEGAWMDMTRRKLATPPHIVKEVFGLMPRAEQFEWKS